MDTCFFEMTRGKVIVCMVARHLRDVFTNLSVFNYLGKTNANKLFPQKKQHIKACLIN